MREKKGKRGKERREKREERNTRTNKESNRNISLKTVDFPVTKKSQPGCRVSLLITTFILSI